MSTIQRAVTPCGWGVKAGMVLVWVAGKTVWSPCYTRALSERFRDKELIIKRCINSPSLLYFYSFIDPERMKGWVTLWSKISWRAICCRYDVIEPFRKENCNFTIHLCFYWYKKCKNRPGNIVVIRKQSDTIFMVHDNSNHTSEMLTLALWQTWSLALEVSVSRRCFGMSRSRLGLDQIW